MPMLDCPSIPYSWIFLEMIIDSIEIDFVKSMSNLLEKIKI